MGWITSHCAVSPMGLPRPSDTKLAGVLYKYIENNQN